MAARARSLAIPAWLPGVCAAVLIFALALATLAALLHESGSLQAEDGEILVRTLRFSLLQAGLSTLASLALGIPLGRALARRTNLPGMSVLVRLLTLPLIVPSLVAIFGLATVHGANGWLNGLLSGFNLTGGRYLYGLGGIVLAHAFFNAPLVARLVASSLSAIPPEHWRLASQFDLARGMSIFRLIEAPQLRAVLPGAAMLVFLLCFTSFAVVLSLGGGPWASNLEVAIYQALRLDFAPGRAALLAVVQVGLCLLIALSLLALGRPMISETSLASKAERPDQKQTATRLFDAIALTLGGLLVLPPLLAIILGGLSPAAWELLSSPIFLKSVFGSLAIAFPAASIALGLALALATALRHLRLRSAQPRLGVLFDAAAVLVLVMPPLVLGAGLFLLLRGLGSFALLAPFIVVIISALLALPFAFRILVAPLQRIGQDHDRLALSLGLAGWQRWKIVELPLLRRPLALAFGLAAALSLGDVSAIALFGSQDFSTLPLLIYRSLGAYRIEAAGGASLALIILALAIYLLSERLIGGRRA